MYRTLTSILLMGYVYCIQPATLVGTNRYKIGMSDIENLGRMKSYKNGSRYLCIFDCDDALDVERKLLKEFNLKYDLIAGREYFEVECELTMISLFVDIVMNHKKGKADAEKPVQQTNWMTKFAFKGD